MKIIIISATDFELALAKQEIRSTKKVEVIFKVTGVGMLATAAFLSKIIYEQKPDFIIQAGIAGSFDSNILLANVVFVKQEFIGDLGVEENGKWKDVFDLKLVKPNKKPFTKKGIVNPYIKQFDELKLPLVNAVTVNHITTHPRHMQQLKKKYKPTIESMEGVALHYICNLHKIPYLQIRSISNYIGERNKDKWKIKEAITNLNIELIKLVQVLANPTTKNLAS